MPPAMLLLPLVAVLLPVAFVFRRERRFSVLACAFLSASAALLYVLTGGPETARLAEARDAAIHAAAQELKVLALKAQEAGDDPAGWALLGQRAMEAGDYYTSANALKIAVLKSDGDPRLILQFAKAQVFGARGEVTDEAKRGLDIVRRLEPDNPEARYFLALRLLQDGQAELAMQEMKSLYRGLAEDSPLKAVIDRQIGRGN